MKQRLLSLLITLSLCLGLITPALAADTDVAGKFPAIRTYEGFADVSEGAWYADEVKLCYETGLMEGSGGNFTPGGTVTVAQATAIAVRIDNILSGGDGVIQSPDGDPWYVGVTTYMHRLAGHNGNTAAQELLTKPEAAISRGDFFDLMSMVVPEELLSPINAITGLPDTDNPDVLAFYNAGILTGVNAYGTFVARKTLNRAELAAMAARIVRPALRTPFTPQGVEDPFDPAFDRCVYLLGVPGSSAYFIANGLTVTAETFLSHAFDTADQLYQACQEQGISFYWENTYSEKTFRDVAINNANYYSLQEAFHAQDNPISFVEEELGALWAKHILVENKALAEELYARLQSDPAQFDALMNQYSIDDRDDDGNLSTPDGYIFFPDQMVASFEETTKALVPGQISAPVESAYGWHIILRLPFLTEEDAWEAMSNQAILYFQGTFSNRRIDVENAYDSWRRLVYDE